MAKTTIPGGYIEAGSIDTASLADTSITADKLHTTLDLTGKTITVATATAGDNDTTVASTAFVSTAIATKLPLAGGTLTGDLNFGDNDKAIFGADSDLQIYHDGSNSYIDDAGAGWLVIRGATGGVSIEKYTGEVMAQFAADGYSQLRYDNATKLATTSTGVDVTGTATMDGLTVDGSVDINSGVLDLDTGYAIRWGGTASGIYSGSGVADLVFTAGSSERFRVNGSSGNIGIGTDTPAAALQVAKGITSGAPAAGASTASACFGNDTSDDNYGLVLGADGFGKGYISAQRTDGTAETYNLSIQPNGGNVGIGTTSPLDLLHLESTSGDVRQLLNAPTDSDAEIKFAEGGTVKYTIGHDAASDNFVIGTTNVDTQQRLVIDSSGNVGIGTTDPDQPLHVVGTRPLLLERPGVGEFEISIDNTVSGDSLDFVIEPVSGSNSAGFQVRTRDTAGSLIEALNVNHDGNVGIGTDSPYGKLEVNGAVTSINSDNDLGTHTYSSYGSRAGSGRLDITAGYGGTMASGRNFVFKYNATSWKAYHGRITLSGTGGFASYEFGGYWNNSGTNQTVQIQDNLNSSCAITASGQAILVTITIGQTVVHPCFSVEYNQSGGDGSPRMDRAEFSIT